MNPNDELYLSPWNRKHQKTRFEYVPFSVVKLHRLIIKEPGKDEYCQSCSKKEDCLKINIPGR